MEHVQHHCDILIICCFYVCAYEHGLKFHKEGKIYTRVGRKNLVFRNVTHNFCSNLRHCVEWLKYNAT